MYSGKNQEKFVDDGLHNKSIQTHFIVFCLLGSNIWKAQVDIQRFATV